MDTALMHIITLWHCPERWYIVGSPPKLQNASQLRQLRQARQITSRMFKGIGHASMNHDLSPAAPAVNVQGQFPHSRQRNPCATPGV